MVGILQMKVLKNWRVLIMLLVVTVVGISWYYYCEVHREEIEGRVYGIKKPGTYKVVPIRLYEFIGEETYRYYRGVEVKEGKIYCRSCCKGKNFRAIIQLDKLFNSTKARIILYIENTGINEGVIFIRPCHHRSELRRFTSWSRFAMVLKPRTTYKLILKYPCHYEIEPETHASAPPRPIAYEQRPEFSLLSLAGSGTIVIHNITVVIEEEPNKAPRVVVGAGVKPVRIYETKEESNKALRDHTQKPCSSCDTSTNTGLGLIEDTDNFVDKALYKLR